MSAYENNISCLSKIWGLQQGPTSHSLGMQLPTPESRVLFHTIPQVTPLNTAKGGEDEKWRF